MGKTNTIAAVAAGLLLLIGSSISSAQSITVDGRNNRLNYLAFNAYLFDIVTITGIESVGEDWTWMGGINDEGRQIEFYWYDGLDYYNYWTATVEGFAATEGWDYVLPDGFEGNLYIYAFPHAGNTDGGWWWTDGDFVTPVD
jgi:hypothetical protein